ncbi:hypothetical protein HAX54_030546, partial [Datura stramonium]|nr:hypothetical protein [Datura stramonium]
LGYKNETMTHRVKQVIIATQFPPLEKGFLMFSSFSNISTGWVFGLFHNPLLVLLVMEKKTCWTDNSLDNGSLLPD